MEAHVGVDQRAFKVRDNGVVFPQVVVEVIGATSVLAEHPHPMAVDWR